MIDGREVSSSSEEWRAECEARWVIRLPSRSKRYEYLEKVSSFRGEEAANELKAHVLRIYEHKKRIKNHDGETN